MQAREAGVWGFEVAWKLLQLGESPVYSSRLVSLFRFVTIT